MKKSNSSGHKRRNTCRAPAGYAVQRKPGKMTRGHSIVVPPTAKPLVQDFQGISMFVTMADGTIRRKPIMTMIMNDCTRVIVGFRIET